MSMAKAFDDVVGAIDDSKTNTLKTDSNTLLNP